MPERKHIKIFDTTLRDGEQTPGGSLTIRSKVQLAQQLERLGVDIIEAGFPMTSKGDFEAVSIISQKLTKSVVCGLARANKKDIDRCWEAVKKAKKPRIHTFVMSSDIQIKYQLGKTRGEVLDIARDSVKHAAKYCEDVEFSAMDASRTDWDYLVQMFTATIDAGATTINVPDTVGYAIPQEFAKMIRYLLDNVKNSHKAVWSVHCHDDLGLSTANSLAAMLEGVTQIECTINGLGERAGNTSMEEIVMALHTRKDFLNYTTGINTKLIYPLSRMVSELSGIVVQPNKAIVGANAFAHESGIHQDGVLKEKSTFEIMKPKDVGIPSNKIVLGKLSGRHAFRERLQMLGFHLDDMEFQGAFDRFKALADKKKDIQDGDIIAIVKEQGADVPEAYTLDYFQISTGNKTIPTATVGLRKDKELLQKAAWGDGPVDAAFQAINRLVKVSPKLVDYKLKAATGGTEALGEVNIRIQHDGRHYLGRGSSTDIIEASVKAYLNAINQLLYAGKIQAKPKRMSGI